MTEEHSERRLEWILGLTAFAAGNVDIISFARLGGILASAMTGNLAFLGYYISQFSIDSAIGSAIALTGFVAGGSVGTLISRAHAQHAALRRLLGLEMLLLMGVAALWFAVPHPNGSASCDFLIMLLSFSMGLQSITGKRLNLSNIPTIVFTSTLTNIVIAVTEMLAQGKFVVARDTKRQCAAFLLYFLGALCAGLAVHFHASGMIFLPLISVSAAAMTVLSKRPLS